MFANVHMALNVLIKDNAPDKQHYILGPSRARRDCRDREKIIEWLDANYLFCSHENLLFVFSVKKLR